MSYLCLFIAVAILISFSRTEDTFKCYYCGFNNQCPYPYNVNDTEAVSTLNCRFGFLRFHGYTDDGTRVLVRGCAYDTLAADDCFKESDYQGITGELCQCDTDKCNGEDSEEYIDYEIVENGDTAPVNDTVSFRNKTEEGGRNGGESLPVNWMVLLLKPILVVMSN